MKTRRLILCLLMSVALTLTFIPTISFGALADDENIITVEEATITEDADTHEHYAKFNGGSISGLPFDPDAGTGGEFYGKAGETVYLTVTEEDGFVFGGVGCYASDDPEEHILIDYDEEKGVYYFEMPDKPVTLVADFYDVINSCGTIDVKGEGWTMGDASDSEFTWNNNDGAKATVSGEIYYFASDEYPHIPIDNGAVLSIDAPNGKHVSKVTINGEEYPYEQWEDLEFTVAKDEVNEGVRTPGNVIAITFEDNYTFDPLDEAAKASAEEMSVGQEATVDTGEKDGLFKFTPEVSGKYVFYSRLFGEASGDDADPVLRVSDDEGHTLGEDVYGGWDEVQNFYFDAEAEKTYYFQATNFMNLAAVFGVGLVENDIVGIAYETTGWQFRADLDTWTSEGTTYWDYPGYVYGDKLTLTKKDGSTETYEYKLNEEADFGQFVNDAGEELAGWPRLEVPDGWDTNHYKVGDTYDMPLSYAGSTVYVPIAFVANPFTGLKAVTLPEGKESLDVENVDDGYGYLWDLTGVKFTFTMEGEAGEEDVDFVYSHGELTSDTMGSFYIPNPMYYDEHWGESYDEEVGEYVSWTTGEYSQPVTAAGFDKLLNGDDAVVPITVKAHQHKLTKEEKVPATCSWEGTKEYWYCDKCWNMYADEAATERVNFNELEIPIDPNAHSWKTLIEPATATEEGLSLQECEYCGETKNEKTIYSPTTFTFKKVTYTGKALKPKLTIKDSKGKVVAKANYTIKYSNNKNAGKAAVATITFKGKNYAGTVTKNFTIQKKANTLKVKAKSAKVKGTKKSSKTLKVGKVIKVVKKGQGKMSYVKASGNKLITINKKTGNVTVKKGLKKGTYKVKVKVKAAGNTNFKASKQYKLTIKIKVK